MKKITALFLAIILALSMTACTGSQTTPGDQTTEDQPASKPDATTKAGTETTAAQETDPAPLHPVTTDPITLEVLTWRHSTATNNAEDVWAFHWLEYWLKEKYGYNVTFHVTQTQDPESQISLLLGTNSLPDLLWGITLTPANCVKYGDGEGMLLDFKPYLNETYMPNASAMLESRDAYLAVTTPEGGIYGLPTLSMRSWNTASSSLGSSQDRMFINTTWLKECNLEMPKNLDEFYDMLRTFKNNIKLEDGAQVIPLIGNSDGEILEKAIWTMHGYYGSQLSKYGTEFAIKNGKLTLPVYTEDYKTFIEVMKTLYSEGLISPDHYTMDATTSRGLTKAGICGAVSDYTMGFLKDYMEWECMPWFTIGNTDELHISCGKDVGNMTLWANAETKYPELVALICDYVYSKEGTFLYSYGPMKDQDPLNMVEGWYFDENGNFTNSQVPTNFESYTSYCYQYIYTRSEIGGYIPKQTYGYELAGRELDMPEHTVKDSVTGQEFTAYQAANYSDATAQGHWFLSNAGVSRQYITTLNLPPVFLSEEDALRADELISVLKKHITTESVRFITGDRSIDEIDAFMGELKKMGIEEYIDLYSKAYADFMSNYFN